MSSHLNKYIEIQNLANPQKVFERLENEFIDIMYVDHLSDNGIIMLLDVNIDPSKKKDLDWLKSLLDTVLPGIGKTNYILVPFNP